MSGAERAITFHITVVTEPDGDGFYAHAPALKGLHTCGSTEKEALQNARNAAIAYLKSLIKHGDPIPVGPGLGISAKPSIRKRSQNVHEEDLLVHA